MKSGRFFTSFFPIVSTFALVLVLGLTACHPRIQDPNDPRFIVAEGERIQVTQGELQKVLKIFLSEEENARAFGPSKFHYLQTVLVDQMLSDKIMLQHAATLSLGDTAQQEQDIFKQVMARYPTEEDLIDKLKAEGLSEEKLKENIHKTLIIQKVLEAEAYHQIDPTEQEVEAFYLQHQARFNVSEKIRASRILIMMDDSMTDGVKQSKKKTIDDARARILAGEDFAKVAAAVSEDRYSAPQGGDIGFFQKGENEDQFDEVAFQTQPGKISAVFQTALGYQFLKVTDTIPGGKLDIAQARSLIGDYLKKEKMKQQEQMYRQKLITQAQVVYYFIRSAPAGEASSDSTNSVLNPVPVSGP